MSKIFEALSKDSGTVGALAPELALATGAAPPTEISTVQETEAAAPARHKIEVPKIRPNGDSNGFRQVSLKVSPGSPVLPFDYSHWGASEQYRFIRTRIVQDPREPKMIVISSGGSGDGKSLTAINVTGALSLKTETALLIDADFRRASIHKHLNIERTPGLGDILEGRVTIEQALLRIDQLPRMYVLTAGEIHANPTELLDSPQWHTFRQQMRERFDYVIIDSPPIGTVADYDLIQSGCDGVLFVARPDHSNRSACFKALNHIPKEKLLGTAINCVKPWFLLKKSAYGSYQQYKYEEPSGS
jgi:protein-tyrosine kinase